MRFCSCVNHNSCFIEFVTPNEEMSSPNSIKFEIRPAIEQDKEQICEHMNKFFFRDEPMCFSFGQLPGKLFYEDLNNLIRETMEEPGHNIVLIDQGKLIGVALTNLQERDQPVQFTENTIKSEKFKHISDILEHVETESKLFEKYPNCNKILILTMISVDTSYRGQGLAKLIIDRAKDLAKSLGCSVVSADCTSYYSAQAFKKLGFDLVYSFPYSDYKENGVRVFNTEPPHTEINVYALEI